ncbi:Nuclear receptor subfamily 2 group F member 5 [Cichlidogyrus casuarinus]|uniref:Nuclear receptor subfamily 2 group F member 5 n=1 Tax=Cichlidogyrus casuarinus TaxID=1844966 RepID=A0ABD2QBE4_9PLAT
MTEAYLNQNPGNGIPIFPQEMCGTMNSYESVHTGERGRDKQCKVCGDKAITHNFGQLTCESCKAFFRRNARKLIHGCKGRGHEVTFSTRKECPYCRLKKCFTIGMRVELIESRKSEW